MSKRQVLLLSNRIGEMDKENTRLRNENFQKSQGLNAKDAQLAHYRQCVRRDVSIEEATKVLVGFWNEFGLLAVGTVFLWFATMFGYLWFQGSVSVSYGPEYESAYYVYLAIRYGLTLIGLLCFWRWVNNKSKWEPHFSGKWIALTIITIIVAVVIILVVAIVNAGALLQVYKGLIGK